MNRHRRASGFTLLEILIVLALLLVIGSLAVVGFTQVKGKADKDAAKVLVKQAVSAIEMYSTHMADFPDNETGLTALVEKPQDEELAEKWAGPYFKDGKIPSDPWGQELKYERLESIAGDDTNRPPFTVWSVGPDKQDGTDDDIKSWTEEQGV